MGEHSSLSLLHKLVGIISFLLLWQFGCGFRAKSIAQVRRPASGISTTVPPRFGGAGSDYYGYGKGLPYNRPDCSQSNYALHPSGCIYYRPRGPSCPPNQGLPCEEAQALETVLVTLGLALASSITRSYCNDAKSGDSITIICNCSETVNLCHIIEITINSKSLSGYIDDDVFLLRSLEKLDLSSNRLYGTIPNSLGTLSNLTTLKLQSNQLTGSIPYSLGYLTNLTLLDLSNNQLSGSIPDSLGKLSKLTYLDLGVNQLSGPIPVNLTNLQSLTTLLLNRNFLNETIPKSLGKLSSLQYLSLDRNKLEGNIPNELGKLTNLQNLILVENNLAGRLPETLGGLRNLRYLMLSSNNFIGQLPNYSNLTGLLGFEVAANSLSGPIPRYITNWVNLTNLNLLGNNFEGPLPDGILNMTKLQYLQVSDLISNKRFSLQANANLTIYSLILRNCSVTGPIPSNIGYYWPWLSYLDLSFNNLTEEIPQSLKDLYLEEMYLTGNMLSGVVPDWINDIVRYKADLSYNNFSNVTFPKAKKSHRNVALNSTDVTSQKINISPNRNSISQMSDDYCQDGKSKYHSLFINSGGEEANIYGTRYEADENLSSFYVSDKKNWAYTCSGDFLASSYNSSDYIKNLTCGVSVPDEALYKKARLCPVSLKYYGFCLHEGSYTVKLHFAEILYTENADYSSLGKRVFDVYVQGKRERKDFNIKEKAGGPNKVWVENITTDVKHDNLLTIHFFWAGKGSMYSEPRLNGPLISAISVTPNFKVGGLSAWEIAVITICSIFAMLLLLALLWRMGLVGDRELRESRVKIRGKDYTLKQIIDATQKFSPNTVIGKGRFGIMYKAALPDQVVVAVKKLYPEMMQKERDKIREEILKLTSLEHENLVQLLAGYSKKVLHLLIYEYMEHGSLEPALFGSPSELNWEARFKICKGIAKGLKYLHEEAINKVIHGNIKTSNILLDGTPNPTAKISEFGLAKFYEVESPFFFTKERQNREYMAPEYSTPEPIITSKADVYSFGIVLLEIVSGQRNAEYKDKQETVYLIYKASNLYEKGTPLELVDRKMPIDYNKKEVITVLDLAMMCINLIPDRRPKMSEVVSVLEGEKTIKEISNVATASAT